MRCARLRSARYTGNNGGTYTYAYDALNRRTSEGLPGSRSVVYTYDASSNLTSLTDNTGSFGYGYDKLNRNCYVAPSDPGGGSCTAPHAGGTFMEYDAFGARTKILSPNGTTTTIDSDDSNKPTKIEAKTGSTQIAIRTYGYDTFGSGTTATTGELIKTTTGGRARGYTYDSSGRLWKMQYEGTSAGDGTDERVYTYDNAGNRLTSTWTVNGTGTAATEQAENRTYTYNGANQLTSMTGPGISQSFTYDGQGNDLRMGYNSRNQTMSLGAATFAYAGPNQDELTNDNGQTIEENLLGIGRRVTSGAATRYMYAADGTLLARFAPGNTYASYVLDVQGSVIAIADVNGTRIKQHDYDPDGNLTTGSDPIDDFGYTQSYRRTGAKTLYKNGLRWYDPETARWTQPDPLDQPGDLQNANPYQYAAGDPVNRIDPNGETSLVKRVEDAGNGLVKAGKAGLKAAKKVGEFALKHTKFLAGKLLQLGEKCLDAVKDFVLSGGKDKGALARSVIYCLSQAAK